ncbi:MAG: response regulator [Nitratireductor sp.]|nr:response regulator [Nitratireductor sp.]
MKCPPRLLAVDDDVASAELIVRVAERCGYEGFATSDSRGVINLTNALKPDIIAVDICMPNIDAIELFQLLANAGYRGEVLIVSGQQPQVLEATRKRAVEIGIPVLGVQQKPLDFQILRETLRREIEARSAA